MLLHLEPSLPIVFKSLNHQTPDVPYFVYGKRVNGWVLDGLRELQSSISDHITIYAAHFCVLIGRRFILTMQVHLQNITIRYAH